MIKTVQNQTPNILVIRSATRILNQTLESLRREFPNGRITVLAPQPFQQALSLDPLIDEILSIGDKPRMNIFTYGLKNIRALRQRKFDIAVSLYNIDHGLGYSNIDLLAWSSGAKKVRGYNSKGTFVEFSGTGVAKKFLLERTTLFWVLMNFLATGILFFLITLGLIGEWCFRQVFSRRRSPVIQQVAEPKSKNTQKVLTQV